MRRLTAGLFSSVDEWPNRRTGGNSTASDGRENCICAFVVRQLLFAGMLDSLTLMVHQVAAGAGRRRLEPSDPVSGLHLQDVVTTTGGDVLASYELPHAQEITACHSRRTSTP